jgi:hypothetical protein
MCPAILSKSVIDGKPRISNPRQSRRQCYQRVKGDTLACDVSKYSRMIFDQFGLIPPNGGCRVLMAKANMQYWVQQDDEEGYFKSGPFEFRVEDIPNIVKGLEQLYINNCGMNYS